MRTSERRVVRLAALVGLAAVTAFVMAGVALDGLSSRSGSVPRGETEALPLADPGGSDNESTGPAITGVAAVDVTEGGATIVWETDVLATGRVDYGLTSDYGSSATGGGLHATSHSVSLEGLAPGTEYHYRVVSTGLFWMGTSQSPDQTFTTGSPPDLSGPVISGVNSENVTASSAVITWATDEDADSQVQYGSTASYGSTTALDPALTRSHSVTLAGLVHGTQYHYRVQSADALGNVSQSEDHTFTTIDNVPPLISMLKLAEVTPTSVTVTWSTDEKADSQLEYGLDIYYGFTTPPDPALVTGHRVTITGLTPGTWYSCRAVSRDASGNLGQSAGREFLTPDETPPVISSVIVTGISSSGVTIRWETDERTDSQVEYGLTANYGSKTPADGGLLLDHSVSLDRLSAQTTYHFRVKSADYWGNWTVSPDATFTTTDVRAPVISGVMAAGITDNCATIVWTTDSPSESIVEFGASGSYGQMSDFGTSLVTEHSVVLSQLRAGTTYHYKVKSRDASGLWSASTDRTFTTSGGPVGGDDFGLLINNLTAGEITSSGATIYWNTSRPATARVEYGVSQAYGSWSAMDGELGTSHLRLLTGLKAGTVYHFRVVSRDADGRETASEDQTFSTAMGRAPLPSLPGWAWTMIGLTGALAVGVMLVRNR